MTLVWKRPSDALDINGEDILEYELVVNLISHSGASGIAPLDQPSSSSLSVAGIRTMEYVVENLEASADYTFRVRARNSAGWGALGAELAARTDPPSRVLTPPKRPEWEIGDGLDHEAGCMSYADLQLPPLRRGCALETALSLEYRVAGEEVWRPYEHPSLLEGGLDRVRVDLAQDRVVGSSASAAFRLRARRGPLISEPSEVLPSVDRCVGSGEPLRSPRTVTVALAIVLVVLLCLVVILCRATRAAQQHDDGAFSKERPPSKQQKQQMSRVRTTDDDAESMARDDDEILVSYELAAGGKPIEGSLPLAGIANAHDLLDELAEFGNELQDEAILSVSTSIHGCDGEPRVRHMNPSWLLCTCLLS